MLGLKEARDGTPRRGRQHSIIWSSSRRKQRRKGCVFGSMEMSNQMKKNKLQVQGNLEGVGRWEKSAPDSGMVMIQP